MYKIFALAILVQLCVQCLSQSVSEDGEDRPLLIYKGTPTRFIIPKARVSAAEIPEGRPILYKALRRSDRIASYQYDNAQEDDYQPQYQQQLAQTESDNYPYQPAVAPQKEYEHLFKKIVDHPQTIRLVGKNKPLVEQYLKEVTPTTKTTHYQRPIQYLRYNGAAQQTTTGLKSEPTDENQRAFLKQPAQLQYALSEAQQKLPYQQLYQYEGADQPKSAPIQAPQTEYTYQSALLAQQQQQTQQKESGLENAQADTPSRSSIYVSQNIPKKPIRTKVGKAKVLTQFQTLQPNTAYYNQLRQQRPQVFEQEPQSARFQGRPTYQKEELTYQPTNSEAYSSYQTDGDVNKDVQYQFQPNKYGVYKSKPLRKPAKYQEPTVEQAVEYESLDKQAARQQPSEEQNYYPQQQQQKYPNEDAISQYQQELVSKYQLQEQKGFRYEPAVLNDDKYTSTQTTEDTLAKYQAALQKLQKESDARLQAARTRQHPRYRAQSPQGTDEVDQEGLVRYRAGRPQQLVRQQYQEETQQYPQFESLDSQYAQPTEEKNVRYRPVSFRQNPSVRYYRNLRGV